MLRKAIRALCKTRLNERVSMARMRVSLQGSRASGKWGKSRHGVPYRYYGVCCLNSGASAE